MASNKRDQLLNTAENLFYREGYHATGIDRILAESGVAKMTLYKHFKSKDELILAVLDARHELMLTRLRERAGKTDIPAPLAAMREQLAKDFAPVIEDRALEGELRLCLARIRSRHWGLYA